MTQSWVHSGWIWDRKNQEEKVDAYRDGLFLLNPSNNKAASLRVFKDHQGFPTVSEGIKGGTELSVKETGNSGPKPWSRPAQSLKEKCEQCWKCQSELSLQNPCICYVGMQPTHISSTREPETGNSQTNWLIKLILLLQLWVLLRKLASLKKVGDNPDRFPMSALGYYKHTYIFHKYMQVYTCRLIWKNVYTYIHPTYIGECIFENERERLKATIKHIQSWMVGWIEED